MKVFKTSLTDYGFHIRLYFIAGPVITVPPVNTNVLQSHNAVLNCTVTGEPVPVVNWYRDATMINQSTKYSIEFSNSSIREYISTLTINNVVMMDTNDYTCSATNIHSNVNATAHVEVQGKIFPLVILSGQLFVYQT